jgi:hypothetical protein
VSIGRAQSPDARFSVDDQNPTVHAGTGYPMCVPRTDPATADDPQHRTAARSWTLLGLEDRTASFAEKARRARNHRPDCRFTALR